MGEYVTLFCPHCEESFNMPLEGLEALVRQMNIGKVGRVAHQLSAKRGSYYDRWKAAMEARGEQKRCGNCNSIRRMRSYITCCRLVFPREMVNPGQFACKWFDPKVEE